MRCNACWREVEGRFITTSCNHLLCHEDANKILSSDGACPICDQVLSKSHMKPVEVNPSDHWVNTVMAGVSPQILMKSVYKSIMFFVGQKDLENQLKLNKIVGQSRQKCQALHESFTGKFEQLYTAYQKVTKRCQMMEQEIENLSKDKQELQDKFSEKCRQKRKLDEMYDQARNEIESMKRSAIQPSNNFYSRPEPDLFSDPPSRLDNRDAIRKDWSVFTPDTPGSREDMWPARQNNSISSFTDMPGDSPAKQPEIPIDTRNRMPSEFHVGRAGPRAEAGGGASNPAMALRNLMFSPPQRPQISRTRRPQLFT